METSVPPPSKRWSSPSSSPGRPSARSRSSSTYGWVYFIIAVYASFVVRPHVIHADGSPRLRYGALLDIRIPAQDIAAVAAIRARAPALQTTPSR